MKKKKQRIKRVKKDKTMYYIGIAITALLILSVGTLSMLLMPEEDEPRDLPSKPPRSKDPHLNIENVFFQKAGEATRQTGSEIEDMVIVKVYSFITNDGTGDAKNVKITALPLDDTINMASDKVDKIVGNIKVNKTSESEFLVQVPKGIRHEVFLMIWEDGRVILKGTGSFMVETDIGTSQEFQTTDVIGSRNDTDYDGMPDAWEMYYGLDPSKASDANEDNDGDGITNRGEYLAGSEPAEPAMNHDSDDKSESEETDFAITFIGILFVVIIVIIIIIAAVKGSAKQTPNIENKRDNTISFRSDQQQTMQRSQTGPVTCIRCGGMIHNLRCQHCGMDYGTDVNNDNIRT
jgi:hypothetical protein